ncbi:IMP dehydrogenase [Spirochaeta cellobiosiphila]|uniref:IMP dehydrogenase n=1 Tax=Spirochaeta cellobiosiphila TaxID=504483 RepID=UPI0004172BD9|nr:IMP dehydrogenase [Spirochaeta cellobiosiphila]
MATILPDISRTFSEFLLLPNLTKKIHVGENVSLKTPMVKHKKNEESELYLNIPLTSAVMQSVSDDSMGIALAKEGGISFIYSSQAVETQAEMIRKVKQYKAGFVTSDSNLGPDNSLSDIIELSQRTGHHTVVITEDGTSKGKLCGIVTRRDYNIHKTSMDTKAKDIMTPFSKLVVGKVGISLTDANTMIWDNKLNSLPIVDEDDRLVFLVFRKDYEDHHKNKLENIDDDKRLRVGAGINTHDYKERVPAVVEAGADILCIDSSDGFSEYQGDTIQFIREKYGDSVKIGAGNVVDATGFYYLAEAGADFVKVGVGGGSICITREQKGIGRGQASALIDVVAARDAYCERTGIYIPICSDGGITYDYQMTMALAMGADFLMLGRYFARFDESPTETVNINGRIYKEYWGEGSSRARNWQRYDQSVSSRLVFEEGVDAYVPYAGKLEDNLMITLKKITSTMCNCGSLTLKEFTQNARLTLVSSTSIMEGGSHDVIPKNNKDSAN